jgi:MOSC domain-containing protein YiiM
VSQLVLHDLFPVIAEGSVVALHLKPAKGELVRVTQLDAVAGMGIVGDRSFGKRRRQVSLVSTHELDLFGYRPGMLRENVTVDLQGLQTLAVGTRLRVGEVELEIEQDCAPCGGLARRLGEEPRDFIEKMWGNRGMLCKVRSFGTIHVGDVVQVRGG